MAKAYTYAWQNTLTQIDLNCSVTEKKTDKPGLDYFNKEVNHA